MGLEVRYVTVFSVIKGTLYHEPPFSTILLKNQGILTVKNGSVMTIACCNPHLELRALALFWMDITTLLMMMKRVIQWMTLMNRNTKDHHIPLRYVTPYIIVMKKLYPTLMTNILRLKL